MTPKQREAAERLSNTSLHRCGLQWHTEVNALLRELLAEPVQEPVAWRDHVEHRLRTWRQQHMNRSGDRLALDDFMDKDSIDDLIDFVCDEYAHPPQQRRPLTREQIWGMPELQGWHQQDHYRLERIVRAIERAHSITGEKP